MKEIDIMKVYIVKKEICDEWGESTGVMSIIKVFNNFTIACCYLAEILDWAFDDLGIEGFDNIVMYIDKYMINYSEQVGLFEIEEWEVSETIE